MNDIEIQNITPNHIQSFYDCLDKVAQEGKYLALLTAPNFSSFEDFINNNIQKTIPQVVALKDDKVIGWCDIIPKTKIGFRHSGDLGMGILLEYRGFGIGKNMLAIILKKAKEFGLERIQLEVFATNKIAIQLYKNFGFVIEGLKKNARFYEGKFEDEYLMAKFY